MNKQTNSNYTDTLIIVPIYDTESGVALSHEVTTITQWMFYAILGQIVVILGNGANIISIICFAKHGFKDSVNLHDSDVDKQIDTIISDSTVLVLKWLVYTALCQSVNMFGIVSNVINIICFAKQGFKDPVNISLFGLAVSDLGCLTTLVAINVYMNPAFGDQDLSFYAPEFGYMTASIPHVAFSRVTAWITALITLERCLCITMPLKVKLIITNRGMALAISCLFIVLLASTSPIYLVHRLDMKFFPSRNKSMLGLVYTEDREAVEKVSYTINNIFIPGSAFLVIIVCTMTLVVKLYNKSKWRKQLTASVQAENMSSRNQKVAKMVVLISVLFISCFIPISAIFVAMILEPEFSIDGKYRNTLSVFGGVGLVLESINSSANIFIYYSMSSKYRLVFRQLLKLELYPAKTTNGL